MAEAYFVCHIGRTFQISLIYAFIGCPQSVVNRVRPVNNRVKLTFMSFTLFGTVSETTNERFIKIVEVEIATISDLDLGFEITRDRTIVKTNFSVNSFIQSRWMISIQPSRIVGSTMFKRNDFFWQLCSSWSFHLVPACNNHSNHSFNVLSGNSNFFFQVLHTYS